LNACPVFREIGGHAYVNLLGKSSPYPGPMGSVVSPALFGQLEYGHLARASSLCGACREACPVDIDLPKLLLRVRTGIKANQAESNTKPNAPGLLTVGLKLFSLAATSPWRFAVVQRLAGIFGSLAAIFSKEKTWLRLPDFSGWGYSKDFPRPAARSFRDRYLKKVESLQRTNDHAILPGLAQAALSEIKETNPIPASKGIGDFEAELIALGGYFISCKLDEVSHNILETLRVHGIDRLMVWETPYLPVGLIEQLTEAGILISHPTAETQDTNCLVRAGLTGASAGIADSGSVLLLGGPGRPLIASLLPEVHIALLWEKDVFENLSQVLKRKDVKQASASVLITGPSRTADIEMALTIGVHGPGELLVICIKSE
jgi:L-lactate utilization protein LutB